MKVSGAHAEDLKNWFGDPYFQVRSALPACPVPRGPLLDGTQNVDQLLIRTMRGTDGAAPYAVMPN